MGTQENKAVVSRFEDMLTGNNFDPDLIDELLAPDYVKPRHGRHRSRWL